MVLGKRMINGLQFIRIPKLKRVQRLSHDVCSSTSENVDESRKGNGLFFVSLGIVVITIFSVSFLYCFLLEYRLAKINKKLNDFERHQRALEEMVERLMQRNGDLENSKHLKHGRLKQRNEISSMPKGDVELTEDQNTKIISGNWNPPPRLSDGKRTNSSIVNDTEFRVTPENVFQEKLRIKRSERKNRNKHRLASHGDISTAPPASEKKAKHFPLIHFEYNSTLVREKQSEAGQNFNFWREAEWTSKFTRNNFKLERASGSVIVKRKGAYLIYAQVVYHDAIGRWSAGIDVNGVVKAKCLESEQLRDIEHYSQENHGVYKQCSVNTVVYLGDNQSVSIKCMYGHRTILSQPEFTFWGLVKLA